MQPISKKSVKLPKSARQVARFHEPRAHGGGILLLVFKTNARVYVQTDETYPEWRLSDDAEASFFIVRAEAQWERFRKRSIKMRNAWNFIENARKRLTEWENEAKEEAYFQDLEEAFLRRTVRARTLDERIGLEIERDAIEEEAWKAIYHGHPLPCLPPDWSIMTFTPDKRQMSLKW